MPGDPIWAAWYATAFEYGELTAGGITFFIPSLDSPPLLMPIVPFAAEHYDPAGDFVARIDEVSDGGRRVKVAVSVFIARQAKELQEYCQYGTTMEETGEVDAEGHRIIL